MTKISPQFKDSRVWDYLRLNSFRSERHKLFYVATPRVACTSLKWWFAELEGYSQVLRGMTDSAETDPDLVIHDTFHHVAPNVTGLSPEALLEPLNSDAYFRFALVRNPYKRIFSAWQSKLLLREPLQIGPYLSCDFFHQSIECADDIAAAFEGFLEHLAANEAPSYLDVHWTPQAMLLRPDLINYSKLFKIEKAEELGRALGSRLGASMPDPIAKRRTNESLIPYLPDLITKGSSFLIRSLYAEDFETFGYSKQPPRSKETFSTDQFDLAFKAVRLIRGRHMRFGEVRSAMIRQIGNLNQAAVDRDGQIAALNQAVTERDGQIAAYQRQAEQFDRQIKANQEELRAAYAQIETQSSDLTAYQRQAEEFNQRVEAAQAELRAAYAQIETQRTDVAAYQRQAEQFDRQIKANQEELRAAYAQIETQSSDLTAYQRQAEQFDRQLEDMQSRLQGLDHLR